MFIYVMDIEGRDILMGRGYMLLGSNNNVWVFENKNIQTFETLDIPCVVSDIFTL